MRLRQMFQGIRGLALSPEADIDHSLAGNFHPPGIGERQKIKPRLFNRIFWVKFIRERKFLSKTVTSPKLILTGQGCRHFMHSVQ